MSMSAAQLSAAGNFAKVGQAGATAFAGFREQRAAAASFKAQAKQAEEFAEAEAEAILEAADQRFVGFMERGHQLRTEAGRISEVGEARAQDARLQGREMVESIKAHAAARGIRRQGSPLEVAAHVAQVAEQQTMQIERDTAIAADARIFEAKQMERSGQERLVAALRESRSTIMTGGANAARLRGRAPSFFDSAGDALRSVGGLSKGQIAQLQQDGRTLFGAGKSKLQKISETSTS